MKGIVKMNAYTAFAPLYDDFMSHIPYEEWGQNIDEYFRKNEIGKNILELGCGTGRFSFIMEKKGYTVIGIDNSEEMVKEALRKAKKNKSTCEFVIQDMRVIEQDKKFDAVISVCDSMNYLADEFDLISVMEGVKEVLLPGGIFLFDMKTEAFYKRLGDLTFTDENENGSYIWKNFYDENTRDNFYEMTFFIHKKKNLYERKCEEHIQHCFTAEEIMESAKKAGLNLREMLDMNMNNPGDYNAQRIYYVFERNQDE